MKKHHKGTVADAALTWGNAGDVVAFGDWDADGDSTPGPVRSPETALHQAYVRNQNGSGTGELVAIVPNPALHRPVVGVFTAP